MSFQRCGLPFRVLAAANAVISQHHHPGENWPRMVSNGAAGLVDRLAQPGTTAEQEGLALAKDIAQGGPIALRMAKAAINHGLGVDTNTGLQLEESYYAQVNSCCRDAISLCARTLLGQITPFFHAFVCSVAHAILCTCAGKLPVGLSRCFRQLIIHLQQAHSVHLCRS